ncbi:MAG: Cysteine desulfurase [uncultured Chthoniobacterales bacterium]|uniref:cysteine desulfurase n=1 Tax=uncultured Chthoniobacterales bacterium TaxID=1836801 RepID=A0A6J4HRD3_9BACT|nr:MAG: Cysteine desulfurase [uncultured Chthoniobacterales bacterium]
MIYLDNNATTQLDPAVLEEMLPFLTTAYGNPSSGYGFAAAARDAIHLARERVAALVGCEPGEIVFTSGGTEASNAALHSALQLDAQRRHIVTTAVEHSATYRYCEHLAKHGYSVTFVAVDRDGNLDLAALEKAIRPDTAIVSAMWANNETGVLFPIEQIADVARGQRVLFHTDAVQAAGKVPMRLRDVSVQYASFSAHKLHGPKGVGALYLSRRAVFRPMLIGGGQEDGRRSGTENVAAIVGFGKAAELAANSLGEMQARVRATRDRFEDVLLREVPDTFVNGNREARVPNTASLSFAGIEAQAALMLLDQQGICCSAGSACHTASLQPSRVLAAMQLNEERINGSLRFSFSRLNTDAEVDRALQIIPRAMGKLRALAGPRASRGESLAV